MHPAHGDPELGAAIATLSGRRRRSVAVATVDLAREPRVRSAYIASDTDTRFEIGSVTKGLTGMLLADAVDRGDVSLDTTVGALVPHVATSALGSVTLLELCTHSSGLPRLAASGALGNARVVARVLLGRDPYRGTSAAGVINVAARLALRNRGRYRYSNLGAAVLGQVLGVVAGTDYASLLGERVLLPIGMRGSGVSILTETAPPGRSRWGRRQEPWIMDDYAPAGAVFSTVTDMSRLAERLLDGSAPGSDALVAIAPVATGPPNRKTGMFWIVDARPDRGQTLIWHNGQTGGHSAFFGLLPQAKRAVVVLAGVARAHDAERVALGRLRSLPS